VKATKTSLDGVLQLTPKVFEDERGFFFESFNAQVFDQVTKQVIHFVQDNGSKSNCGVLRGLHYQLPPKAQGKLVRVVQGSVFDVAVDLRRGSPTLGQWYAEVLSAENHLQVWIPAGFAHGFLTLTLSDTAEVLYKTTATYAPECERSIVWNDPDLAIAWPDLGFSPQLSEKDLQGVLFRKAELFD
jgi:dTDP-4-dehydrorhamnose 3,5-epimerase